MDPREVLRILLIGTGGREHAFAWKLGQSPRVEAVWVAPGNGGTYQGNPKISNIAVAQDDFHALINFAKSHHVNLVVPGGEAPLVAGITDACHAAGLRCFGPSKAAAKLEGSKAFAKAFMERHSIPTAAHKTFTDAETAKSWLRSVDFDVVIKADGLAAGKGVVIPESRAEAERTLDDFLSGTAFGDAGRTVVLEEYLTGQELSVVAFVDGFTIKAMPAAQDHKQAYDGDKGPMTGYAGCELRLWMLVDAA
jgi:phosphoribosylamine--glycine ligase / phosphoribosylformylglycinamidine cyclo-ligase